MSFYDVLENFRWIYRIRVLQKKPPVLDILRVKRNFHSYHLAQMAGISHFHRVQVIGTDFQIDCPRQVDLNSVKLPGHQKKTKNTKD
jgi:hypothetical protein